MSLIDDIQLWNRGEMPGAILHDLLEEAKWPWTWQEEYDEQSRLFFDCLKDDSDFIATMFESQYKLYYACSSEFGWTADLSHWIQFQKIMPLDERKAIVEAKFKRILKGQHEATAQGVKP